MGLSDDDVREILRIIDESELDELRVETEGFALHVRRAGAAVDPSEAPQRDVLPEPTAPVEPASAGLVTIASPMLGVFYRAGAPGGEPFVDVGTQVGPTTTVCIIEVMKMMNSVPAGVTGTVVEVLASNGSLVEPDEPLFRVRPG